MVIGGKVYLLDIHSKSQDVTQSSKDN